MVARGLGEAYKEQIKSLYILHTLFRIENAMLWVNLPHEKKEVVISSLMGILDLKYPNWQSSKIIEDYKSVNGLFKFDMNRLDKYSNAEYRIEDRGQMEENISQALK